MYVWEQEQLNYREQHGNGLEHPGTREGEGQP